MRFAATSPWWIYGGLLALLVAALLVTGGVLLLRAIRNFGDEPLVLGLVTGRPGGRRALKGALLVLAVALAFVALSQPQYGRGTRSLPATNLDVVIALDYSKSMYARDITPSRTLRAKSEVSRLIADLPGARFGAVAFAGDSLSFPLTSDGGAIAQFFRQLTPQDMPVGGTAIARALQAGLDLFAHDPRSAQHQKVLILVTDGEDLEGDPVAVAESAKAAKIQIHVVQVGGRTPEPLPEMNEAGQVLGWRKDDEGKPLTTSLSAEGEAQLAKIAETTEGQIVRSAGGKTGIDVVAARLRKLMTEELSERVEVVYADVYYYPLALAVLLLLIEAFVNETPPRAGVLRLPPPARRKRRKRRLASATAAGTVLTLLSLGCSKGGGSLFDRRAPTVDSALAALEGGDAGAAVDLLQQYLSTGKCENGTLGLPAPVNERPNASFDLGLALFQVAERFGQRFGEDPPLQDGGVSPADQQLQEKRGAEVDCALMVVRLIASDLTRELEFRARALYLAGNLEFLRGDYKSAVKSYDAALKLLPGVAVDAGDPIGRDAAHNRAIALRKAQEQEEREKEQQKDAGAPDSGQNDAGPPDAGDQDKPDSGDSQPDAGKQDDQPDAGGSEPDAGDKDAGSPDQPSGDAGAPPEQQPKPQESPTANQDEAILDELEQTPTVQQEEAKNQALKARRARGSNMEDK